VVSILANNYIKQGYAVDIVLLLSDNFKYNLDERIKVISYTKHNTNRLFQLPMWLSHIRRYVINNKPDCIISFLVKINLISVLSCLGLKVNIVLSERNDPRHDGRSIPIIIFSYLLYSCNICKKIVFQTNYAMSCFPFNIRNKGNVIVNPIEVKLRRKSPIDKIIAVGRLSKEKNFQLLIKAFCIVVKKHPNHKLFIYGEGELRKVLEHQIELDGLDDKAFLPGQFNDIYEHMIDAQVFVLTSNHEGQSNALLEAMAMGIPCITTNISGINEIIQDGVNGILVEKNNALELSKRIIDLLGNEKLQFELSKNALLTSERFKCENVFNKWDKIIFECIERGEK